MLAIALAQLQRMLQANSESPTKSAQISAVCQTHRVIVHRGQARSYGWNTTLVGARLARDEGNVILQVNHLHLSQAGAFRQAA